MELKRCYYKIKNIIWSDKTGYDAGLLKICKSELIEITKPFTKTIKSLDFEVVKPGENTRIIHLLDTIQPMWKSSGQGCQYSGMKTGLSVRPVFPLDSLRFYCLIPVQAGG